MKSFYDIKNSKICVILNKFNENKITENQFISIARSKLDLDQQVSTGYRTLNRMKDAKILKEEKIIERLEKAERDGFFRLESFCDCYRKTIKISYATLRTRIFCHTLLTQYLIDNDIIVIYKKNSKEDRNMIVVNYEKRFEFIELILKSFLTKSQLNSNIR